jgi:hypothetical protein
MRQVALCPGKRRGCGLVYLLVAVLGYSSAPKMEAIRSSETSLNIYQTLRCHIPRGRHRGEHHICGFEVIASSRQLTYCMMPTLCRQTLGDRMEADTGDGTWVDCPSFRDSWLRIIDRKGGGVRRSSLSSCRSFRLFPTLWCSGNT